MTDDLSPSAARTSRFGVAAPDYRPAGPSLVASPAEAPPKRRRRLLIALLVLIVAGAGYGAFRGGRATSPTPPGLSDEAVTAVALPAGTVLSAADLRTVAVTTKTRPAALTAAQAMARLGDRVRQALPAGTLITASDLTTETFPSAGEAVVGLELTAADTPSGGLATGDVVGVVYVADASQPPYPGPVPLARATVWSVSTDTNGTNVALLVPTALASLLSADASHSEITLVRLDPTTPWP